MNRIRRELDFIYWKKESNFTYLTQQEFAQKVNSLSNRKRLKYSSSRGDYVDDTTYSIRKEGKYLVLYLLEEENYNRYSTNYADDKKTQNKGHESIKLVGQDFEKQYGIKLFKAFGTTEEEFKRCIPRQFEYINEKLIRKESDLPIKCSSIDGCSQYPAHICGRLPDAHTAVRYEGTVQPNEEYPFAFYINSGHVAEYKVFDTHDWFMYDQALWSHLFRGVKQAFNLRQSLTGDKDITVLMKASSYELSDIYKRYYEIKETYEHDSEEYQQAKLVMNASIGMMHQNEYRSYRYAHLAAIAIARANNDILKKISEIGLKYIVQVCVDGIIYLGNEVLGQKEKELGKYHQEFVGCIGKVSSMNRYIFFSSKGLAKAKWQGCNRTKDNKPIGYENIESVNDQYGWWLNDVLKEIKEQVYEETIQEE